ncbi:acyl-CoA synthetase FdrA [Dyella silvae]|uniref:acyl-CoA synthetase FdrA n=1 Tax=Dyella silvae TaxID=2994424 RepID=UPI002263D7DA|nr:acyl-CoA synthetase FdrA [Dyella silvae]
MSSCFKIFKNLYRDSVSLMQVSARISKLPGVAQASVAMGTEANRAQLRDAGLGDAAGAGPNDLIVAVAGDEDACELALSTAADLLSSVEEADSAACNAKAAVVSLQAMLEAEPATNLALISVPGDYAAAEAEKAIRLGMNVMLFSDNVSLQQEKAVKTLARERRLMVMGPDCGTAIVNGMPLGFANVVRRGAIGLVAASGTGLQEVTCRIDQLGAGVSQALGTGGHDLHEEIGGISMLHGLDALIEDAQTRVIVLVSKPPAQAVAEKILARARAAGKPVVVNFLGAEPALIERWGVHVASTLADAAERAVALLKDVPPAINDDAREVAAREALVERRSQLAPRRRYIRGVFAGGTFCYESQLICQRQGIVAFSNTPIKGNHPLDNVWQSTAHTLVDMGDDAFTRGRPHPMIDPTLRNERIVAELRDPETAVVLFDLVLGYGAALEPAAELTTLIGDASRTGNDLPLLIAHVCGTDADPQNRNHQIHALREAGVLVANCNAQAAYWAAYVANLQKAE